MYYQIVGTEVRLAGSLHMVPAVRPVLPHWVPSAFEWCDQLGMEHNVASFDWLQNMALPAGETLEQKLPPHLWQQLNAAWPANHPRGMLINQRLWIVLVALAFLNIKLVGGVEPALTALALERGKPINYLETPQEFATLANSVEDARYIRMIESVLNELPQAERIVHDLYDAWLNRGFNAVAAILPRTIMAQDSAIKDAILDRRNAAWMPKILEALPLRRRILIVVGALHLVGPTGLVALLNERGHEVTPVV
jgi:uncharacterized protein